jgi:hypothetical protein
LNHENGGRLHPEAAIRDLAAHQHGVFSRDQAFESGVSRRVIDRCLADGTWELRHRGVYRLAGAPATPRQSVMAAVLWGGNGAVASHLSAAGLYRLPAGRMDVPEVSVPRDRMSRHPGIVVHRPCSLPGVDLTRADNIPATTVARTIVDLAGVLPADAVEENLDYVLSHGYVPRLRLEWRVGELAARGRPGVQVVRALLDARAPGAKGPESILETRLGRILSRLQPVWGYVVIVDGRVYVLDCAFLSVLLAIEADGWASHCGRLQWEDDLARQNALVRAGWTVLRYPSRVIANHPERVESEVIETMARLSAGR